MRCNAPRVRAGAGGQCHTLAFVPAAEGYWVEAASEREARRLVARNVSGAKHAGDARRFECEPDSEQRPSVSMIHRRLGAPIPIRER